MTTKPEQTPEQRSLRLRGYELYLAGDGEGRRRSLRSIAMTLGVTLSSVQYWRRVDKWDERVSAAMQAIEAADHRANGALGALLRQSLYDHVVTLNTIIRDSTLPAKMRVDATKAFVDICHKLKVVTPEDLDKPRGTRQSFDFKDDLGEPHGPTAEDEQQRDVQLPAAASPHSDDLDHDPSGRGSDVGGTDDARRESGVTSPEPSGNGSGA